MTQNLVYSGIALLIIITLGAYDYYITQHWKKSDHIKGVWFVLAGWLIIWFTFAMFIELAYYFA